MTLFSIVSLTVTHTDSYPLYPQGNFGTVTLYLYDPANDGTGEYVAVKALKQGNDSGVESWIREIKILKSLKHINIVKYKGCCTEMGESSNVCLHAFTSAMADMGKLKVRGPDAARSVFSSLYLSLFPAVPTFPQ